MFLFSCCTSHEGQYAYQIRQDYEKVSQTSSALDLQEKINNSKQYVRKVKRSKFQQLLKSSKKEMFKDLEFPPNRQSLGQIPSIQTCNWRRLSQIVPKPSLFTTSKSTILKKSKQSLTPDYFLSAMSAITQKPRRIKDFFKTETINDSGLYCVMLRVNGQIEEVIVDDYVPVNEIGQPIFAEPNSGEIWICLAEKAWAKINGSYANVLNGNSAQVFKAFNFAPSQIFFLEDKQEKKQKLWKRLTEAVQRKSPVSCLTSHNQTVDWIHLNLIPNFQYTLVYATQVLHKDKKSYRMIKLKNPYSQANWDGKGSSTDAQFWGNVLASQEKINLLQNIDSKQGEFTMLYTDFVKYFSEIYISYQLQQGNFIWEEVFFNQKNGGFWEIDVTHDGQYSFELHKQSERNKEQTGAQNSYCRSTIVLAKVTQPKQYEFVSGAMRFAEQDVLVNAFLKQGKYIVYVKIQSPKGHSLYHGKSSLSCYSNRLCRFRYVEKKTCQNFLQNMFLNFARQNKRQQYNRQKMWLSWKLLFKECGFAFIAFGNAVDSDKKFSVKFQSKDFQSMHFKLKSPFKADKTKENTVYQISIMPGQQKIILARVINDGVITLKFPPPIQMKIQDLKQ